jgi:hypothetical protein
MKRNEAIELLEKYNYFLEEEGYADSDLYNEETTALDKFLMTKWAKENLPIKLEIIEESIYASLYKTGSKTTDDFRR